MGWRVGLLAVALGLAATPALWAATETVGGDDLFCEGSLQQAEKTLEAAYADLDASMTPLDRARLRRAHTDWLRFRDSDCAFATSGTPGWTCCLQRQTEERADALRLYLAQVRVVDFRTWPDPIHTPEKDDLLQGLTRRSPKYAAPSLPDQILRVGDAQYLLAFASTLSEAHGLEYVNLRRRAEHRILEGRSRVLRVLADAGETRHAVVMCDTVDRRVLWRELYTVSLGREEGRLAVRKRRLALFREDAGSGRCDRHSAEFLKMDKALVPGEVRFADVDGDGVTDIAVAVAEIDCRTQEQTERTLTFLADNRGFGETERQTP